MASVAAAAVPSLYSSSSSISRSSRLEISLPSSSSSFSFLPRTNNVVVAAASKYHNLTVKRKNYFYFHGIINTRRVNAAAAIEEEETGTTTTTTTLVPEEEEEEEGGVVETAEAAAEQTVTIPVSPSDIHTMCFQAEGTMKDSDVPKVITALEEIEGIGYLDVRVEGSVATVELTKLTTSQAKGVAANLVEVIQGSGFKLQTLNLSFMDEVDEIESLTNY